MKKNIQKYQYTIFLIVSFIIGIIFGYYCGLITKSSILSTNSQKTNTGSVSPQGQLINAEQNEIDPISIFSLDGKILFLENNVLTVKPSYGPEDIIYKVEISETTEIHKAKQDFDPEKDEEMLQRITTSDLKPNNAVYIESKNNIINQTTIQASYIEVMNE